MANHTPPTEADLARMAAQPRPAKWDDEPSGYDCDECGSATWTEDGKDPTPICHECAQKFAALYPAICSDLDWLIAEVRRLRRIEVDGGGK